MSEGLDATSLLTGPPEPCRHFVGRSLQNRTAFPNPFLPQAELIGHEKEGKRDESRRAALHAQWQEAQDDEAVQRLLKGVQYGFRSRRARRGGVYDDEVLYCHVNAHKEASGMP